MSSQAASRRVAVIGAGIAGATCARLLAEAGHQVQVFDKSRDVGGRLATRRSSWSDNDAPARQASFDHGTPGFSARTPAFDRFVRTASQQGWLQRWSPTLSPRSHTPLDASALWVPVPDMPALCRHLLTGIDSQLNQRVDALQRQGAAWRLSSQGQTLADGFDQVVVAVPGPQADPLLLPHQPAWAQQARATPMRPCWTLMGVADLDAETPAWDLARPQQGPLACIQRVDHKPGRTAEPGFVRWVAHATASWSQQHLDAEATAVQQHLLAALDAQLGQASHWRHVQVHRWLYANALRDAASPTAHCRWHAESGLGVCSDALGGAGVEGAWLSGSALATAITADSLPTGERNNLAAKRTSGPQARDVFLVQPIGLH